MDRLLRVFEIAKIIPIISFRINAYKASNVLQ